MKITRIFTGADGASRFEDIEVELSDKGKFGFMSELEACPGIVFREVAGDYDSGWHNVPGNLYLVILDGAIQVETGDGSSRRFGAGAVLRAEDCTGGGHRTRAVGPGPVRSILVTLSAAA